MINRVETLVREVAAAAVLPRFGRLSPVDIAEKGPGDVVTTADHEAERMLTDGLTALLPGSIVIGEEAVADNPARMSDLSLPGSVWVVDPVDGTANFAAGREPFAIMVALLRGGRTVASCILDPISGVAATAEIGSGAFLGGQRVVAPRTARATAELRGLASTRYTPAHVTGGILKAASHVAQVLPGHNCAGYEYPALVRDEQQFAFFWRLMPWDHAPGILFVEEAGGVAWHLDGTPYEPTVGGKALLVAQNADVWQTIRSTLFADVTVPA